MIGLHRHQSKESGGNISAYLDRAQRCGDQLALRNLSRQHNDQDL